MGGIRRILPYLCCLRLAAAVAADVIEDQVLAPSVTVTTNRGSGSGVIFIHEGAPYVITADHVVRSLRSVRTTIADGGERKTEVWSDANVVQVLVQDGRQIGKIEMFAEVLCSDEKEDIALLRVRRTGYFSFSARFVPPDVKIGVGELVLHCGSRLGQEGANSLTDGIVSAVGRVIDDEVFDQTSAPASPGSSGGGIFSREGEHLGMVTLGAGETFVLFVPARRIAAWLEAKGYGFLCPGWAAQPVAAEAQVPLTPPEASPVAEGAPDDH